MGEGRGLLPSEWRIGVRERTNSEAFAAVARSSGGKHNPGRRRSSGKERASATETVACTLPPEEVVAFYRKHVAAGGLAPITDPGLRDSLAVLPRFFRRKRRRSISHQRLSVARLGVLDHCAVTSRSYAQADQLSVTSPEADIGANQLCDSKQQNGRVLGTHQCRNRCKPTPIRFARTL